MARMKITMYIDENLLRSARDLAERTDRAEDDVFEDALRRYLDIATLHQAWDRNDLLDEEESLRLAYEELHQMRAEDREAGTNPS